MTLKNLLFTLLMAISFSTQAAYLLHDAAAKGDVEQVERLIARGFDPNNTFDPRIPRDCMKDNSYTALHLVALNGWTEKDSYIKITNLLIGAGANLNIPDSDGRTPLAKAVICGANKIAKLLIDAGAKLDVRDNDGYTPLHNAANYGNTKSTNLLIEAGVDLNVETGCGCTPLHVAVYYANIEVVRLLIAAGANLEAKDDRSKTPLDYVLDHVQGKGKTSEILRSLLGKGL